MLGLEKSQFAKKLFAKYRRHKISKYHGIHQKEIQGSKILLDLDDPLSVRDLFFEGLHGYAVTSCFYNEVERGMTIFDIGASVGYYTLIAARLTGEGGSVFSFEPSDKNCELIRKNIELNTYKNITVINKAVGEKTKKGKLFINPYESADNRIIELNDQRETVDIEIISLDGFVKKNNVEPNFVKIDVQASEYLVLDGMSNLLKSKRPLKLIIEFSSRQDEKKAEKFVSSLNNLSNLGLDAYYLKEPKKTLDVKSNTEYETNIKFSLNDFKNPGFSKFDEVDLLFIRK